MTRIRSPGYPAIDLGRAIDIVRKIHAANRTNAIERDAAVKDMGYSGVTGASGKMLANLLHFGLLEKAGKGGVRVSQLAVEVLHPDNESKRREALVGAAFTPELFDQIRTKFPDGGVPSENALRSYLAKSGFAESAISPAVTSFIETCRFLEQERAYESQSGARRPGLESPLNTQQAETSMPTIEREQSAPDASIARGVNASRAVISGERVVFSEEGDRGQYLQLLASGEITDDMLEAVEDYVKRQRRRLLSRASDADKE